MSKLEREGHLRAIESHIGEEVEVRDMGGRVAIGKLMLLCGETRRFAVIESKRMVRMLHIDEVADTANLGSQFLILATKDWRGIEDIG